MILSGQSIRQRGIITPFFERRAHLGMTFGLGPAGYDVRIREEILLDKGGFILASTIEYFDMPFDIIGRVHDKSTWARMGIAVQNTIIEPGWRGFLTLEITNHAHRSVNILLSSPIAQIVFELLDFPVEKPYDGKYQDQPPIPVEAKYE